jgi:hypothetical protein
MEVRPTNAIRIGSAMIYAPPADESCRDNQLTRLRSAPAQRYRGVDLISDALPFGRLRYGGPDAANNAIDYAKFRSRSHDAVIRVYDERGNVIETHEHAGDLKEW